MEKTTLLPRNNPVEVGFYYSDIHRKFFIQSDAAITLLMLNQLFIINGTYKSPPTLATLYVGISVLFFSMHSNFLILF